MSQQRNIHKDPDLQEILTQLRTCQFDAIEDKIGARLLPWQDDIEHKIYLQLVYNALDPKIPVHIPVIEFVFSTLSSQSDQFKTAVTEQWQLIDQFGKEIQGGKRNGSFPNLAILMIGKLHQAGTPEASRCIDSLMLLQTCNHTAYVIALKNLINHNRRDNVAYALDDAVVDQHQGLRQEIQQHYELLRYACGREQDDKYIPIIQMLIDFKVNPAPEQVDNRHPPIAIRLCSLGWQDLVRRMMQTYALDYNQTDSQGRDLLYHAIVKKMYDLAVDIIQAGASITIEHMKLAIQQQASKELILAIIECDTAPSFASLDNAFQCNNRTDCSALHYLVEQENTELVELFRDHDIGLATISGYYTPFYFAVVRAEKASHYERANKLAIVNCLLKSKTPVPLDHVCYAAFKLRNTQYIIQYLSLHAIKFDLTNKEAIHWLLNIQRDNHSTTSSQTGVKQTIHSSNIADISDIAALSALLEFKQHTELCRSLVQQRDSIAVNTEESIQKLVALFALDHDIAKTLISKCDFTGIAEDDFIALVSQALPHDNGGLAFALLCRTPATLQGHAELVKVENEARLKSIEHGFNCARAGKTAPDIRDQISEILIPWTGTVEQTRCLEFIDAHLDVSKPAQLGYVKYVYQQLAANHPAFGAAVAAQMVPAKIKALIDAIGSTADLTEYQHSEIDLACGELFKTLTNAPDTFLDCYQYALSAKRCRIIDICSSLEIRSQLRDMGDCIRAHPELLTTCLALEFDAAQQQDHLKLVEALLSFGICATAEHAMHSMLAKKWFDFVRQQIKHPSVPIDINDTSTQGISLLSTALDTNDEVALDLINAGAIISVNNVKTILRNGNSALMEHWRVNQLISQPDCYAALSDLELLTYGYHTKLLYPLVLAYAQHRKLNLESNEADGLLVTIFREKPELTDIVLSNNNFATLSVTRALSVLSLTLDQPQHTEKLIQQHGYFQIESVESAAVLSTFIHQLPPTSALFRKLLLNRCDDELLRNLARTCIDANNTHALQQLLSRGNPLSLSNVHVVEMLCRAIQSSSPEIVSILAEHLNFNGISETKRVDVRRAVMNSKNAQQLPMRIYQLVEFRPKAPTEVQVTEPNGATLVAGVSPSPVVTTALDAFVVTVRDQVLTWSNAKGKFFKKSYNSLWDAGNNLAQNVSRLMNDYTRHQTIRFHSRHHSGLAEQLVKFCQCEKSDLEILNRLFQAVADFKALKKHNDDGSFNRRLHFMIKKVMDSTSLDYEHVTPPIRPD